MDVLAQFYQGLMVALQLKNVIYAGIGVLLGTAVGVLPGIGPALTVALLLPVTFKLDPTGSLIMFAGIYYGGMYGGSTTAILINTPGESASMATALEGNKMAKAGRGGPALATSAIGSFVAGTIATIGLAFLAPWLVDFAVRDWYTPTEAGIGDTFPFVDNRNAVGVIFFGTLGYMIFPDYSSYHTYLGPKREPGPKGSDRTDPMVDLPHFRNFVQAVRNRKQSELTAEIEEGHKSAVMCHLANIAYRLGRTVQFDPVKERFVNDAEADKHLSRDYRKPFVVPATV